MDAITAIWNAIVSFVGAVVNFVMTVWNDIVGPALGAVIEEVKNVVTIVLNQILNTVTQPMLSGQTTSLDALFGGVSPSTIVANAQSPVSSIGTTLDSQSSQLSSVGSSMQSMMSSLSVFSGAGTILGPLIEMTGPGIMSTLFQLIGNVILNSIIMPLVSQFTSTVLENDVNTLTSAFGGINQTITQLMNILIQATSIIDQSGTTKQTYGSGSTSRSTGSPDVTGGTGYHLDNLQITSTTSGSSGSPSSSISGLLGEIYSASTLAAVMVLSDDPIFVPITVGVGMIITGFNTIMGSYLTSSNLNIVDIGLLSAINDALGLVKTTITGAFTRVLIQRVRLTIDAYQTILSAKNLNNPFNSAFNAFADTFWLIKSGASMVSDIASFFNDLASADSSFQSSLQAFIIHTTPDWIWNFYMGGKVANVVTSYSLMTRIVCSLISAVFIGFTYLNNAYLDPNNTMTSSQNSISIGMTAAFMLEAFGKAYLYYRRFNSNELIPNNNKFEQVIYGTSAIFDLAQMGGTLFGILPS